MNTSARWRRRRSTRCISDKGPQIDFLGVSFSALDLVGHAYGPDSHEVQDVLARLDVTIGELLDHLDRTVGAGKYVVAFSADHGVAQIPEQIGKRRPRDERRYDRCHRQGAGAVSGPRQVRRERRVHRYLSTEPGVSNG